jgi:uncharacterized protein YuzE
MTFHYYEETDSLYIDLVERPASESQEVADGVVLDFDEAGRLVGIDVQHASERVDLSRLRAVALPILSVDLAVVPAA